MPYALEPPDELHPDPAARLVAARPRARRGERSGPRRSSAGWRRCSPARRRSSTTTPRRTRSTARSTSIADALRDARRPLGALLRDVATATGPSARARASPRTAASSSASGASEPAARRAAWSARTPPSRSPTRRSQPAPRPRRRIGVGLHVHAAEDVADERDATRAAATASPPGSSGPAPSTSARCSRTASTSTTTRSALVRAAGASIAHNARSNMNNVDRPRAARRARRAGRARHGRDRLRHVRGVAHRVLPPARGRRRAPAPTGRSTRLAEGARLAGRAFGEPLLGHARRRALPPTSSSSTTRRRRRSHDGELRRALGLRALVAPRPRRDGRRRVGRPRPAARRASTSRSSPRRRALAGRAAVAAARRDRPTRVRAERRTAMAVTTEDRVALYLQDKHPIREGMRYVAARRGVRLRGRLAGREPARARGDRADGRVRRGDRADRDRLGRREQLDAQRRAPRRDVLDPRRPRARPGQARDRRVVGPARREGRHPPPPTRPGDARDGRGRRAGCSRWSASPTTASSCDLDDVEIDIVHGDRSPKHVPIYIAATTGMKMMELAGEIGDGVLLNYLVGPGYNQEAMEHLADRRRARRPHGRRRRPAAARRLLARRRPLARARPGARARHAVPRPAAAHHEGERRRPEPCSRRSAAILTWPATPEQIEQAMAPRPRRRRPADHRVGHGRRVPRQGAGVRRARAAPAPCSTRSATTSRR